MNRVDQIKSLLIITTIIAVLLSLQIFLTLKNLFPYNIVFLIVLVLVLLYIFLDRKTLFNIPTPHVLARQIASFHLTQIERLPGFSDLVINKCYPLYSSNGKDICAYDIKLVDTKGNGSGYILISVNRTNTPVMFFTSEGPSISEILAAQILDAQDYKVIFLTPTYLVALNNENKIIASFGEYIFPKSVMEEYRERRMETLEYLKLISKRTKQDHARFKKLHRAEWKRVLESIGGTSTSDLVRDSWPTRWSYSVKYAEGHERAPEMEQIPPNKGKNNTDNKSGCGPTAWLNFLRWHDFLWTPELLIGSENTLASSWGQNGNQNTEPSDYENYNSKVIMILNDVLEVFGVFWNEIGYVSTWNMDQGFDYIETLGHTTSSRTHWHSHETSIKKAKEYIYNHQRPSIIYTGDHYCVVAGYCENLEFSDLEWDWVYIITGWKSPRKGYLNVKYVKQMWYTQHIKPRAQYTFENVQGGNGMEFCNTKLDSSLLHENNLWAFWLSDNGNINYMRTASHEFPTNIHAPVPMLNSQTKVTLNVNALFAPSTCADDSSIYLIYVDLQKRVHLLRYKLWKEDLSVAEADRWQELVLPEIYSEVRPAITGGVGSWLTIVFCDRENGIQKISTNKDIDRPNAWPDRLFAGGEIDTDAQSSWYPIYGFDWQTYMGLGIAQIKDGNESATLICWISHNKPCFWYSKEGDWGSQCEITGSASDLINDLTCTPSLVYFNHTVFLIGTRDYSIPENGENRIGVYYLDVYGPGSRQDFAASLRTGHPVYVSYPAQIIVEEISRLTETTENDPAIGYFLDSVVLGWLNTNNKLTTRAISIDTKSNPIHYPDPPH